MFKKVITCLALCLGLILPGVSQAKVKNLDELMKAEVMLSCRTKFRNKNMGGGSATRIYHEPGGPWVLVTASHVSAGCLEEEDGKLTILDYEDLRDKDGNIYKGQEIFYEVTEVARDAQHDIAILVTKRSFGEQAPYLALAKDAPAYGQTVWTAGYPGPFRDPATIILTKGIVNAPAAPIVACKVQAWEAHPWSCSSQSEGMGVEVTQLEIILSDANISPGNSGGAMFNQKLELMGVTVIGIPMFNYRNGTIPVKHVFELLKKTEYNQKILKSMETDGTKVKTHK